MQTSASSATGQPAGPVEVFDARGLQAPDNVLAILRKVAALGIGAAFEVRLDSNPFQLYDLLQQRGFFLEIEPQADGTYRGTIRPRDIASLRH